MSSEEAAPRTIQGRSLKCLVCQGTLFQRHKYLLNTRASTFLNVDWADRGAVTYICEECGHILWFRGPQEPEA